MHWRFKLKHYKSCESEGGYCHIVSGDKTIFQRMENGEIPYEEALKLFKNNNKITDDIPMEEFITWLRGLGWNV